MDNTPISTVPIRTTWLGFSSGFWDHSLIVGLTLAALVAVCVVVVTWGSIATHKREAAEADRALVVYKSDAEQKIAVANSIAETARLEQERLKQLVKWRTVLPDDMKALVAELAKGSGEIDIAFAPSDPESEYFAFKIIGNDGFAAVNDSGGAIKWRVYLRPWISNAMFFGIAIPGPENAQINLLRRAFSAAHIKFSTEMPPDEVPPIKLGAGLAYTPPPQHDALIVVGLRNPPL